MRISQIQKNQNTNFKAKLKLEGSYNESPRWQTIAKDFETKTAKKFPEYNVKLQELPENKMKICLDKNPDVDRFYLHEHTLSEDATKELVDLPNNKIINKLTKLLNLCKGWDKLTSELPDDIEKLGKKYGLALDSDFCDKVTESFEEVLLNDNYVEIYCDDILSDYIATSNTFFDESSL